MLYADLVTPSQGQGQWKWYKMEEVNGAYKHGRYEEIWLNSLRVMSNVKLFATQDGWLARQTQLITYIQVSYGSKITQQ